MNARATWLHFSIAWALAAGCGTIDNSPLREAPATVIRRSRGRAAVISGRMTWHSTRSTITSEARA